VEAAPVAAQAETLPFTGLDSGIIALLGATSLAAGVVLRRRTRQQPEADSTA
jgi:hypothetical protein